MLLYRCAIRSVLEYGCEAFDSASSFQKKRLDKIQYSALKIACGAMVGTSLAALQVECGDPPLDLRRKMQIANIATKAKIIPNHPVKNIFVPPKGREGQDWRRFVFGRFTQAEQPAAKRAEALNSKIDNLSPVSVSPPSTPPWMFIPPAFDERLIGLQKDDPSLLPRARELIGTYRNSTHIYTDASKINERAAIGVYVQIEKLKTAMRVTDNVSIYTAELTAIKWSLEWMARPDGPKEMALFTDSYSSILSLKNSANASKSALVASVLTIISNIQKSDRKISLIWVPSHIGIPGNEIADGLAKEAIKQPEIQIDIPPELADLKRVIRREVMTEWQARWNSAPESRHYWSLETKISNRIKFASTNRKKEVVISRLRLGKCRLNHNMKKINLHKTGLCETCGEEETIEHWLLHCKNTVQLRNEIESSCKKMQKPTTLQTILNSEICHGIIFKWTQDNHQEL